MLAAVASGYHGLPNLTATRAFTSWKVDGWTLAWTLVLAVLYLWAVRVLRRRGEHWAVGRIIAFCGLGLGFAVIGTMSSIGVYQPVLFYMRSIQTILFLLVVPLFLAMGRPLTLIIETVPRFGPWLAVAIKSKVARLALFPAITTFVLVLMPFFIYFTNWYSAGFRSVLVAQVTHLALSAPGFLFFWTLLRVDPVPREYPYVLALWITAAEVLGDAALGLSVVADTNILAPGWYHALGHPWSVNLATSQVLGGGVLWIFGDVVGLPFLAAQLIQMIREDEADAQVIDAELDAQDAAAAASAGQLAMVTGGPAVTAAASPDGSVPAGSAPIGSAPTGSAPTGSAPAGSAPAGSAPAGSAPAGSAPAGSAPTGTQRPWWETDRRFADRFRELDEQD
jgi:cytochrome c oxidase assembly factor CtaG